MAALDFPASPANNQIYTLNGVQYYYNGVIGAWLTNLITNPINANTTNTQILFNDAGYTNGSIGLVFNKYSNTFATGSIAASGNIWATGNVTVSGNVTSNGIISTLDKIGVGTTGLAVNQKFLVYGGRSGLIANAETYSIGVSYSAAAGNDYYYIGATSGASPNLIFSNAGGAERVRISTDGNVGIGNTSPALKLEVAGNMSVDAFVECSANISTSYTITTGRNAMSAGPITLNSGVTVTIPSGSTWTVV
ncbi:hypothetical protein EB001_23870 [bacterium]|nr:hypothetical protein [bacterium]